MRWVALPAAPLDFSARVERGLLLADQPFLEPVHASRDWRIWEVRDPEPPVSGPRAADRRRRRRLRPRGDARRAGARAPARVAVLDGRRGDGCVSEDRDSGWTLVDVGRAGTLRVRARFSAAAALRREPDCGETGPTQGDPLPASAVSPPVRGR